jgi:site-specific recombinase XerD
MDSQLLVASRSAGLIELASVAVRAREYVQQSRASNTVKAYRSDWQQFESWCGSHGLIAMPAAAETVALYITDLADQVKPSTIQRRIASISQAHQAADHESPTKSA